MRLKAIFRIYGKSKYGFDFFIVFIFIMRDKIITGKYGVSNCCPFDE